VLHSLLSRRAEIRDFFQSNVEGSSPQVNTAQLTIARLEKPPSLTPRELEIALLMAEDSTNNEIAQALNLSVKTIEFHKTRIYERLHASGPAGVVRWAIRNGYLSA
jgi:DNA-binding NarL/FixJ family response regulator